VVWQSLASQNQALFLATAPASMKNNPLLITSTLPDSDLVEKLCLFIFFFVDY
jgi:hypothetical protein